MADNNPFTSAKAPSSSMKMALIAPELAGQQISVGRLQQLAAMLQQKALQDQQNSGDTKVIGGWAIPNSKLAGLSNILSSLGGAFLQNKSDRANADLMKAYSEKVRGSAFGGESVGSGAVPAGMNAGQSTSDQGGYGSFPVSGAPQVGGEMPQQQGSPAAPPQQRGDAFNMQNTLRAMALGEFSPEAEKAFWAGKTPTEMQRQNEYLGIDPTTAKQMKIAQMLKEGTMSFQPGQTNVLPNGQRIVAPDFKEGIAGGYDAQGNPLVNQIPGANAAAAQRAAVIASANEGARPTTITTPDGRSIYTTVGSAIGQNQPQAGIQPMGAAPKYTDIDQKYGFPPGTMASIEQAESGGDPNAVSPKGAQGRFQIMPDTQRQPGYGLGKLDPNNPEDAAKYLKAMQDQSGGDLKTAIGKYNAGPAGNLNNPETRNYIKKVTAGIGSGQPQGIEVQSPAGEVFSKEDAKQKVDFASKYEEGMSNNLKKSSELMQRLNLTEKALKEFKSGGGTEARANLAQHAQMLGLPQNVIDKIAGGDLGAMQVVNKTALTESLLQMQHDLASDTGAQQRSNQMIMQKFMDANPHLDTDPRAWEKLLNLQKDIYTGKLAEANDYWKYKQENKGDTRQFPTYWAKEKSKKLDATKTNNNPYTSQQGKAPANIQLLLDKYK